jgi:regulator of chromosome condensation
MLNSRFKNSSGLKIESLNVKNVIDIGSGSYHSFLIKQETKRRKTGDNDESKEENVYAWGLNNFGQLGIGNLQTTCVPTKIHTFEGKKIVSITGGEHHSIAVTSDGEVFGWGKNEEGQTGKGDTYSHY